MLPPTRPDLAREIGHPSLKPKIVYTFLGIKSLRPALPALARSLSLCIKLAIPVWAWD
jgi:hypothetical protein